MKKRTSQLLRIVTNSERASFACERRWFFRYILGLVEGDSPAPLRMGSLWHRVLAAFYRSIQRVQRKQDEPWTDLGAFAAGIAAAVIDPWLEERVAYAMTTDMPQETRDELLAEDQETATLTRTMFRGYAAAWAESDVADWEILYVEAQAARPLLHPVKRTPLVDYVEIKGKKRRRVWHYGGQLDVVIRRRSDGSVWFVEHKTTADRDLQQYKRKLSWDPQIRGYAWILGAPIPESEIKGVDGESLKPVGVIYNVARKKAPGVPQLVKASKKDVEQTPRSCIRVVEETGEATDEKPGKPKEAWKRLSQSAIDTTRDVFLGEVLRHGFDPDDHADMLEQLKGNLFFDREYMPLTDAELEDFERDAEASAVQKMAAQKAAYHPRQTALCTGIAVSPCPYAGKVCLADGPMSRRSYTVLGIRHAELVGDFAEPYAAQESQRMELLALPGMKMRAAEEARPTDPFCAVDAPATAGSALTQPASDGSVDPFASVE